MTGRDRIVIVVLGALAVIGRRMAAGRRARA